MGRLRRKLVLEQDEFSQKRQSMATRVFQKASKLRIQPDTLV